MKSDIIWSSKKMDYETPQPLFNDLDKEFGFTIDVCADEHNHKCERYYTKEQDGLRQDWTGEIVFCNPPYGKGLRKWVEKCFREVYAGGCKNAILLIPARTDTKWFHDFIYHKAEVRFLKGRLRFGGTNANAPFPSMVVIFRGGNA